MKHLILAGILAVPTVLVACQSNQESVVVPADAAVVKLDISGMT